MAEPRDQESSTSFPEDKNTRGSVDELNNDMIDNIVYIMM